MSTTEENLVPTETPEKAEKAPTGKDAFKAARESLRAQSVDQGGDKAPDDTSTAKPAEEPEKVADQPTETAEEPDTILNDEELAKLSPKDRANAEKWQAKLTQRGQALSAREKELAQAEQLLKALTDDPDAAIEELAKQRGLTLSKAKQDATVEQKTQEAMSKLPAELEFLRPIFDEFGKQIMESMRGEIQPLRDSQNEIVSKAVAAETTSTIEAFSAKYPEWQKHEGRMLELGQKFMPTAGAMSDFEYMETLYRLATADTTKAEQTKKIIEKINKSAASVEPNTSGVSSDRVEHVLPPPGKRSIRDAFKAASRGERWVK